MSRSNYHDCRQLNLAREAECPISYEELSPCKTNSISILKLGLDNTIYSIYHMKLDVAKHLYVDQGKTIDFKTQTPIKANMRGRIALQLKLAEYMQAGLSVDPTKEHLIATFDAYLKNPATTSEHDMVLMKTNLHMDDSGFLSEWIDTPVMNFRDLAIAKIATSEPGSWLLRKASVVESDVIKPRCITFKNKLTGNVDHLIIAHIYGFGYTTFDKMARGYKMPQSNNGEKMPQFDTVYESFIDILESLTAYIDLEKIVSNS